MASGGDPGASSGKSFTIEKTYQKKSQLEHILLRPDTYVGSVEPVTEQMWVYDTEAETMVQREITYVPGLYKIFDEILVNAADNKQRDKNMNCIKININAEINEISIWNNGKGIPVVEHKDEKMYVPTMIFGHLLTSSNYNDEEAKVTGGRNGYGAKLCNIFSTKFTVETSSREYKKAFKQSWSDNMGKAHEVKIKPSSDEDYTKITFSPDLTKFRMEKLDKDIVDLLSRRAYDVAASTRGVKVFLNGTKLPIKSFKDYVELYIKGKEDDTGNPLKVVYESVNDRWEVAVTTSEKGFQQVSFVNSIATTKGGRHVDYVTDALVKSLIEHIKKKNKGGMTIKPFQVKNHMWVFINCLVVNPTFDSQTKENMTLQAKNFGSKCQVSEKFLGQVAKSGLVEQVLTWAKFKAQTLLEKAGGGKKKGKLRGIPKLDDANDAGGKNSQSCTLILTEGDSAKALAVSGLGVVGRDKYGVFPLRGKLLNVREATHKQILENAEINNIIKIVGLKYKMKYESREDLATLRYGKIMIMTDQDQDGSHIKGLIVNFIHHNWPSLIKLNFLEVFITPIVKASKRNQELSFYSIPEFDEWKAATHDNASYRIKYYKGLGTSTSKEAKEYFSNMDRHRIKFKYSGPECDQHIIMAFSKKCVEQRKEWLTNWMEDRKRRKELGMAEEYLYTKETKHITFKDFVNKELVLFSNADNERSIPSVVDGLKPGQRKVLFTCLKRNDKREVKVAQLAGSVAEHSAYHHGEMSLMSTIINLAQNYVGTNNINLLQPIGQFGTRLQGGKDAASPRYIFTMLSPLARMIFHPHDDPLLKYQTDDNQRIEPVYYVPVIPMVLVNGSSGIGTGWMTQIPNYNPRELVEGLQEMIAGKEPTALLKPWYKGFRGEVDSLGGDRYVISGEIAVLGEDKVEITELPVGTWTHNYKESVLEPMLNGNEKTKAPPVITDFKEYHTDTTVKFIITLTKDKLYEAEKQGLHKFFKLQSTISLSSMCAFDKDLCLRRYDSVNQILKEFYDMRLDYYDRRKNYLEGMLQAEADKLSAQARFIMEKCDGKLTIENKKRAKMVEELKNRGYPSDPVKAWKKKQIEKGNMDENSEEQAQPAEEEEVAPSEGLDYDYLLGMTMWTLTLERKEELINKKNHKVQELEDLKMKTPGDIWTDDLKTLRDKLDEVEEKERQDENASGAITKKGKGMTAFSGKKPKSAATDSMPSPSGRRIKPEISEEMKKKVDALIRAKEKKAEGGTTKGRKKKGDEEKDEFDKMEDGAEGLVAERKNKTPPKKREKGEKGAKKSPKKKMMNFSGSEEEDFDSDADFSSPVAPVEKRTPRRSAAANVKFNFDSEGDSEAEWEDVGPPKTTKKKAVSDNEDDDAASVDSSPASRPPAVKAVNEFTDDSEDDLTHKKNNKPANNQHDSDRLFDSLLSGGEDKPMVIDSSDDDKPAPKAKPAKPAPKEKKPKEPKEKKAPAPKRPKKKKAGSSDGESDDMFAPKAKKPAPKKKKKNDSDSELDLSDDGGSPAPPPSRSTTGRARKPTKYTIDDSDDMSD